MKQITLLVGPPGSGKSTRREAMLRNDPSLVVVSQDDLGKAGHHIAFNEALARGDSMVIDKMNFSKKARAAYINNAKYAGYTTEIVVLHEASHICMERMLARKNHPTISDAKGAGSALHTFMSKYERPEADEADVVTFVYPDRKKPTCVPVDLDGTLCNIDHRLHFVRGEGKKDWKNFMYNIPGDSVNLWCHSLIFALTHSVSQIIYCSGRGDEQREVTKQWLLDKQLYNYCFDNKKHHLYMRQRGDHRHDYIVKEIILDFEVLTQFTPLFFVDDRKQVVDMYRKRGFTVLQCAPGEF